MIRHFEQWETQDLELTFGIEQLPELALLENWLKSSTTLTEYEQQTVEYLRKKLLGNADFWNEDELKLQFIAPLLWVVNFDMPHFKMFSQRLLSAMINGIEIGGRVDFVFAKGKQKPIKPYFFIHEYKQECKGTADPKGQLLAELLVAQVCNESTMPLYGCYVVGRNWFFLVLQGQEYAVSDALIATRTDIYQIIAMLRAVKEYILRTENLKED